MVNELKEKLRFFKLTTGSKAELVGRLMEAGVMEEELNPIQEPSNEESEAGTALPARV